MEHTETSVRWRTTSGRVLLRTFDNADHAADLATRLAADPTVESITVGRRPVGRWTIEQVK